MFGLLIFIIVNSVFILFYLQVEPVYLRVSNKPIQITSRVINIGNTENNPVKFSISEQYRKIIFKKILNTTFLLKYIPKRTKLLYIFVYS